jgi:hypothetical protein
MPQNGASPPGHDREETIFFLVFWGVVLATTVLVYLPGLHGPLVYDDIPVLGPFLREPLAAIPHPFWTTAGPLGRPVAMASFWLDAYFWHGSVFALKLTNLLIALLVASLAALLGVELVTPPGRRPGRAERAFGTGVAAFWLLAPAAVATVLYAVERMELLAALFTFAGLLAFARLRRSEIAEGRSRTHLWLPLLLLATVLATLSKENGILLLPLALWTDLCLWRFAGPCPTRRTLFGLAAATLALGIGLVAFFFLDPAFLWDGYRERRFTLAERLLTEPRVLVRYLAATFVPRPRWTSFFHGHLTLSHRLFTPPSTALALAAVLALLFLAVALRRRRPLVALGLGWFLIGESIESTLVPLRLMEAVRVYLPSYGLLLAAAALLVPAARTLVRRAPRLRMLPPAALATAALASVLLSAGAVVSWRSARSFYSTNLVLHPHAAAARAGLAQWWLAHGRPSRAVALLAGHRRDGEKLELATVLCLWRGTLPNGYWSGFSSRPPPYVGAATTTGIALLSRLRLAHRCRFPTAALARLTRTLARAPRMRRSRRYILVLYRAYLAHDRGRLGRALADLVHAGRLERRNPVPRLLGASWLLAARRPRRARRWFEEARGLPRESRGVRRLWRELARRLEKPTS